jgi:hypothetical protein
MFLIQTNQKGEVEHDFSFTLLKAIELSAWKGHAIPFQLSDTFIKEGLSHNTVPVGSVEFVRGFLKHYHGLEPKPVNVPEELCNFHFTKRTIVNVAEHEVDEWIKTLIKRTGEKIFIKSNDVIKGYNRFLPETGMVFGGGQPVDRPAGNYQISTLIDIKSEWRAFVFKGILVGLQNYAGDFTIFPNVTSIKVMVDAYKSAPVAYTLDVGVNKESGTFVIECHDFFSCGLYGFANLGILPAMFSQWFHQFLSKKFKNGN